MLNSASKFQKLRAADLTLCALFCALIAVGALLKVPVPLVPFTLQTLFVYLAGLLLGRRKAFLSVFLYILLGLAGLPIFTGGGGIQYVFKPLFGYIIGFALAAYVMGSMTERIAQPTLWQLLMICAVGMGIIYLVGLTYFYVMANVVTGNPIGVKKLLSVGFIMVLPGDILKCILASFLAKRLLPVLRNLRTQ